MRILVTKLGVELVKIMSEELNETMKIKKLKDQTSPGKSLKKSNREKSNSSTISPHNRNKSINNSKPSKQNNFFNETLKKNDHSNINIDAEDLLISKHISINQKKIHIPKNVTEKYNSDIILPDLSVIKSKDEKSLIASMDNFGQNSFGENRENYKFKEILNKTSYFDLKNKLKKEKKITDSLSRVDESNFRTVYGEKNKLEKLEDLLNSNINSNRLTLIKYINQHENISDLFLKKISEGKQEKIIKANKICQIVFHNKEKTEILNEKIKEKIVIKKNKEISDYKSYIVNMGNNLKDFSSIMKGYNKPILNRGKYKDIHNETAINYWKKFNVERLMHKTRSKSGIKLEFNFMNLSKSQGSTEIS